MIRQSVLSTEYLYVPVELARSETGEPITTDAVGVEMAFGVNKDDPFTPWMPAEWVVVDGVPYARKLIGPEGDYFLGLGKWGIWLRFTSTPEIPVRLADRVKIWGTTQALSAELAGAAELHA